MKTRLFFLITFFSFFIAAGAHADSTHLLISQIQIGSELSIKDEFVELYNPTDSAVSLTGWRLVKKTKTLGAESTPLVSSFAEGTIVGPHKFFLITHRTEYRGAVAGDATYPASYYISNNNTVILLDKSGAPVDKVGFGEEAKDFEDAPAPNLDDDGKSLKRKGWEGGEMVDTDHNQNDFDPPGPSSPRKSSYGGTYTPPAQENPSSTSTPESSTPSGSGQAPPPLFNFQKGDLLINEFYPVADSGEKEWVEIINPRGGSVNLDGWTMEDSRTLIASLYGAITKYSVWEITPARLNNDGDTVKLKSPNGQIIDIISYGKMTSSTLTPQAGESLARKVDAFYTGSEADFVITETPTPGEKNVVTAAAEEEDMSVEDEEPAASSTPVTVTKKSGTTKSSTAKKISGAVAVNGTVIVPPGLFATQYFYIQKDEGGGVQIYSFKAADIPKLKVGDRIYVYGTGSTYLGEPRIKTKLGGIKILGKGDPPEPLEIGIDELDEEMSGTLVKISGEITEKKSAGMYLDDGNGEIYVNVKQKAGISLKDILPGNEAEVAGVLIYNDKGFSVLPRFGEDIKKLAGETLLMPKDASLLVNILKYTLPTLAAIGLGVLAYFWRMKKKLVFEGAEIVEEDNADMSG